MFQMALDFFVDYASISVGLLMFLWHIAANKKDEGGYNIKFDLATMFLGKLSPWIAVPLSIYKLVTGGKEVENKIRSPWASRSEYVSLLWWSIGLEMLGLSSSIYEITVNLLTSFYH